jgi:cellulose synthase/poly-beta-1,6-N-acetylglucosamine synthase-like glycosyltransferase
LIGRTLRSIWGTYPRLEVIVVDEASDDDTVEIARRFALAHGGVMVLTKPRRGGKSSAVNFARNYTRADVLVLIDGDSILGPIAVWEIVQPLKNPRIGVASGMLRALNAFHNVVTWLQALEYLNSILVGRILMARLNLLGISSGAFSAYRAACFDHGKGKDIGPTEDLDLSLRIRKSGYDVAFVPGAVCYTDVPDTWRKLFKQRRFWEQGSTVKLYCRKHRDMAWFRSPSFRWSNFFNFLDIFLFDFVLVYVIWLYFVWLFWVYPWEDVWNILATQYVCYVVFELLQAITAFCYTDDWKRDLRLCLVVPVSPLYQLFLRFVALVAHTEELFWRKSFDDPHVPRHVRDATWHW